MRLQEIQGPCSKGYLRTKLTQDVEGDAEEQRLETGKVGQTETWGYKWNVYVVVAPGPWNELEETAKSWALREQAGRPWAWVHWVQGV